MKQNNRLLIFILILFPLFLSLSCNVEKNRKWLSVFFDGIPQPDSVTASQVSQKADKKKFLKRNVVEIVSIHPDYKTKNCSKCHSRSASSFLVTNRKEICFICHKKEKFLGEYVHGPVAVKACNTCHVPHKSVNRKLLHEEGNKLCVLCHRTPITGDSLPCKGDNCLDCHEPHVSSNKYFLKKL